MISIIVPVYNVEKYLVRCLDSILAQDYSDYEILLIDDGSTDLSGQIADEYTVRDSRIKVWHRSNEGAAAARNFGLDQARGEYICFIDSDDWVESTYLYELHDLIIVNQADIAMCRYQNRSGSESIEQPCEENVTIQSGIDAIDNLYSNHCLEYVVVWNKIYKRDLFNEVRFTTGMIYEDEVISPKILIKAKKVARTERILYNYRTDNEESVMSARYSLKNLDILKAIELRMEIFKNNGLHKYYEKDSFKYLYKILLNEIELKQLDGDNKAIIKDLKNEYWIKYKEALSFDWTIKRKIGMLFFGICPKAYLLRYNRESK